MSLVVQNPPILVPDNNYIVNILARSFAISVQPRPFTVNWNSGTALQLFDIKDPLENVNLTFNYSPGLAVGETLTGVPIISVTTNSGTDPMPANIINGAAGFDTAHSKIVQPVTAGINGVEYEIVSSCATSLGRTLALVGLLPVRR